MIHTAAPSQQPVSPIVQHQPEAFSDKWIAHNISQRFQKEGKFSGKLRENLNECLANYDEACADYGLNEEQKLKFVHNLFDGEAKQFFRNYVQPSSTRYQVVAQKMIAELNNITRQNRVRLYLQGLKLPAVIQKENCDVTDSLGKFRTTITRYAPQGPMSYRTEEAKVEYLYNSVIGLPWTKPALTQCYANLPPWNFQQLYTALDAAWLQEQRQAENKIQPVSPARNVFWEVQGMYGVPTRKTSSAPKYPKQNRNFNRDLSKLRGFN